MENEYDNPEHLQYMLKLANKHVQNFVREIRKLRSETERHRVRYDRPYQYWRGRRDEAGWLRDKLDKLLKESGSQ